MIRDALLEIEEYGPQFNWFKADVVAVDYLCDAIHCLERARFDAVLLDLQLPDSPLVFNTFGRARSRPACRRSSRLRTSPATSRSGSRRRRRPTAAAPPAGRWPPRPTRPAEI